MPLSEEEQRILHEMEQKLYEHDRAFVGRVRSVHPMSHRPLRSAGATFVAGFAVVVLSFRSSLLLATFGFLVMLLAALMIGRGVRHAAVPRPDDMAGAPRRARPIGEELSLIGRRFRARFWQQH